MLYGPINEEEWIKYTLEKDFLVDLTRNTDIDGLIMTHVICHYKEDIDEKLLDECRKFKEYLR